jgi:putative acetyltransferase
LWVVIATQVRPNSSARARAAGVAAGPGLRFGFSPGGALGFRKPSLRIPDDAFMALPLPSYEPWMSGTLVYSQVFWEYDAVGLR